MRPSLCLLAVLCLSIGSSCGGDDDGGAPSIDADPNAPDADPNAADADPNQADGGGGGVAGEVECGDGPACESPEGCCISGGKGGGDQTCMAEDDCMEGIFQACDGRNDCGADYCCLAGGGFACVVADDCNFAVCSTPDDCPTEGDMCCKPDGEDSGVCNETCGGK
jgi:hypothetical protein